jgi:hypothetical protein
MPKQPPAKRAAGPKTQSGFRKRVFKTAWFAKAAAKRGISDTALCEAIEQVKLGQAIDMGGGVWKKKLNDNMDRSIIAAKGSVNWIFLFLFQKKDRQNISRAELAGFKKLADGYAIASPEAIAQLLENELLVEISSGE